MRFSTGLSLCCGLFLCAANATAGVYIDGSIAGSVSDGSRALPYRLFEPAGASSGDKIPLILALHGSGERGTDNVSQTTNITSLIKSTRNGKYSSYLLAPQIGTDQWFQSWTNTPTQAMALTIKAVKDVIATHDNIDTNRIYVTGLSMGGMGTWDILYREQNLFAAAAPMSGGGDTRTASAIKNIPVWAFHGNADTIVPVSATRDMVNALIDVGGSPNYTEIDGGGHVIWDPLYDVNKNEALYEWMFSQQKTGDTPIDPVPDPVPGPDPVVDRSFFKYRAPSRLTAVAMQPAEVPEPGTMSLVLLGAVAMLMRRNPSR